MKNKFNILQKNIKFNKEDIHSKDTINKPIMVIADTIEVYLLTENAPINNYGIAFITERYNCDLPVIYVDKYFLELDYANQLFTLYHELGHYVNKDLERFRCRKEKFYNFIEVFIKKGLSLEEQRADLYAYTKLKEHYPTCINKVFGNIFYDIRQNCIQRLIDEGVEGKDLKKYKNEIIKEFNIREKLLRKNIENDSISFYDPKE